MELRENIIAGIPEIDQEAAAAVLRTSLLASEDLKERTRGSEHDTHDLLATPDSLIRGYFLRETSLKGTVARKTSKYLHDSSGAVVSEYEYGYAPNGDLEESKTNIYIAGIMRISGTNKEFYIKDALGSTILLLDPNANIKERYSYAPFGSIDYQNGTSDNTKQFTGKEIDEESGYIYFGARFYNSEIGRWISRDPNPGRITNPQSLNRYQYCLNNPVLYVDLWGFEEDKLPKGNEVIDKFLSDIQGKVTRNEMTPDQGTQEILKFLDQYFGKPSQLVCDNSEEMQKMAIAYDKKVQKMDPRFRYFNENGGNYTLNTGIYVTTTAANYPRYNVPIWIYIGPTLEQPAIIDFENDNKWMNLMRAGVPYYQDGPLNSPPGTMGFTHRHVYIPDETRMDNFIGLHDILRQNNYTGFVLEWKTPTQ